jgi:ketosteroid isomerase-like protein
VSAHDLIRRIFATFDAQDVPTLAAFMADDIRLRLVNGDETHGKTAFVEAVNGFLASIAAVRHQVLNVWTDRDIVGAEFDVHYTRLDGGQVTLPCCNVVRVRDGLIAEYRSYLDSMPVYVPRSDRSRTVLEEGQ